MLSTAERWGGGASERPYLPRAFSFARALQEGDGIRLAFLLEEVGPGTERLAGSAPATGCRWSARSASASARPARTAGRCWWAAGSGPLRCCACPTSWRTPPSCWAFARPPTPRRRRCLHRRPSWPPTTARPAATAWSPSCWPPSSTPTPTPRCSPAARPRCWRRSGRCAPSARCRPSWPWSPGWRAASGPASAAWCPPARATSGCAWTGRCSTPRGWRPRAAPGGGHQG